MNYIYVQPLIQSFDFGAGNYLSDVYFNMVWRYLAWPVYLFEGKNLFICSVIPVSNFVSNMLVPSNK